MTSYLAVLAVREFGGDGVVQSPVLAGAPSAVSPRHVGRYELWAMPAPEMVERDQLRAQPAESNDASSEAGPRPARAVAVGASTATMPVQPARGAMPPTRAPQEADAPRALESDSQSAVDSVRPSAFIQAPAPVSVPNPINQVATSSETRVITTRVESAKRDAEVPSSRDERIAQAPAPTITPAFRAPVPLVVTAYRTDARASMRAHAPSVSHDAPPAIVVTIGRIEVRAVPAPVAPRAVRGGAPTMSLDDYLRERTRGLR